MKITLKHLKPELMSFCLTEQKKVMMLDMSKHNVRNLIITSGTMGQWSSGYFLLKNHKKTICIFDGFY